MLAVVTEDVNAIAIRDRPEPGDPAPGEVVLRPEAVGVCGSDFRFIAGELSEQAGGSQFPRVLGHEVAGTIVALGDGCRPELETGQRVALWPLRACEFLTRLLWLWEGLLSVRFICLSCKLSSLILPIG